MDEIELTNHRAMIELPENAIEATIIIKVYHDSQIVSVTKDLNMQEIREAFRKADEGYIDEDDRFVLTDLGSKWLEGINCQGSDSCGTTD